MDIDNKVKLTDLIEKQVLQRVQDSFAHMTGMAALITDADGVAVTEGSNFSEFCGVYTRASETGGARCRQCDKKAVSMARKQGGAVTYLCHAGIIKYAVPIMVESTLVGCFLGGQFLTQEPDYDKIREMAAQIGVDTGQYMAAAGNLPVREQGTIDNFVEFLYMIADLLSEMAYNKYLVYQVKENMRSNLNKVYQAYEELEQSENMKSDFLANMSHEIRTPMNAVIGMAEMALREELTPVARDYIKQIRIAGRSLLAIINDILDFSKIESGRMDINEVIYEPMSMIYDVANIIMTRLKNKDVELILDVAPNLPNKLWGDNIRIKQVLVNLANNAAKFTSQGRIVMKMDCTKLTPDEISLQISVEDTGIGIKKEDVDKLFQSFSQVDSKRNRNIEGTGLGLAISKNLLMLMSGNIWVESVYGKGSRFAFMLPQKIADDTPCIGIREPESVLVAGLIFNSHVKESLCADASRLGVGDVRLLTERELCGLPEEKRVFLFIERCLFSDRVETFVRENPQVTSVLIIDFYDNADYHIGNLLVMKKPLFSLNIAMILNGEEWHLDHDTDEKQFDFIAPDAEILIVDDNAVNLTVAEGLLEPLKMKVDTVTGGKEAIEKISEFHYDIIFMDHMMPELDGVETTRIIRRFHPEYDNVPIIALTANAVEGTKDMFIREGMNDFVAKPIEMRILASKVRQWLPDEKIQMVYNTMTSDKGTKETNYPEVADLNVKFAMESLGSEELFQKVLKVFYRSIGKKAGLIRTMEEQEDWRGFTIEVHALKNSARQIGALLLADQAEALEKAGNARDGAVIHSQTDDLLQRYTGYLKTLEPFCQDDEADDREKEDIAYTLLQSFFAEMKDAAEDLDMDKIEDVIRKMERYQYAGRQQELFHRLREAAEEMDADLCEEIIESWEGLVEEM